MEQSNTTAAATYVSTLCPTRLRTNSEPDFSKHPTALIGWVIFEPRKDNCLSQRVVHISHQASGPIAGAKHQTLSKTRVK